MGPSTWCIIYGMFDFNTDKGLLLVTDSFGFLYLCVDKYPWEQFDSFYEINSLSAVYASSYKIVDLDVMYFFQVRLSSSCCHVIRRYRFRKVFIFVILHIFLGHIEYMTFYCYIRPDSCRLDRWQKARIGQQTHLHATMLNLMFF